MHKSGLSLKRSKSCSPDRNAPNGRSQARTSDYGSKLWCYRLHGRGLELEILIILRRYEASRV